MQYSRITDTSPASIRKLNDMLQYLFFAHRNITNKDLRPVVGKTIDISENPYAYRKVLVDVVGGEGGVTAGKVVCIDESGTALPADKDNISHASKVIGIAETDIPEGIEGRVQTSGEISNPEWELVVGNTYYLDSDGYLISIDPSELSAAFIQKIGIATGEKTLLIQMVEPLITPDIFLEFESYLQFPVIGDTSKLYIDLTANKMYRWDNDNIKYFVIGSDYEDIAIINGGDSISG